MKRFFMYINKYIHIYIYIYYNAHARTRARARARRTTERSAQLDEQRALAVRQAREKAIFEASWRAKQAAEAAAAANRERESKAEAKDYASSLQQQVAELTIRDAEASRLREEYDALKAEMNKMFLEQEAREKREAAIRTVRYGRTLQRQHKELLKKQSEEVKESLVEDLRMLEELARVDAHDQEAKTERRQKAVADVEWMKEEVQQQLEEEKERLTRFEALYRDEAQRMFAKQEAVWDREKLMRKKLMESVLKERAEQLKEREAILRQKSAKSVQEREDLLESIERERQFTVREAQTQRELVRDRRDELDMQMDMLASEQAAERSAETVRDQTARKVARRKQQILDEEEAARRNAYSRQQTSREAARRRQQQQAVRADEASVTTLPPTPLTTSLFVNSRTLMGCTDPLRRGGRRTPSVPSRLGSKLPHLC